jgi:aspartate/methionine/tyrosine aminotransferase
MENGGGPEKLRSLLAQMKPEELGLNGTGDAAVLNRLQISLLTEGSGTQLFSTTFVQWAAREVLRRAQPLTVLARFAPRQREESMRELISGIRSTPVPDPEGSLVDADMGAFYTWINLQRLPQADKSAFLVWFENHGEAVAIAPGLARGRESTESLSIAEVLNRLS